ncbi:MAG: tRNA lysidine(34) synthetase TilS [Capsulimonadaceae bacterium]
MQSLNKRNTGPDNDLIIAVRQSITRFVDAGQTVVAAVSGGPDSLAMLHVLHRLKEDIHIGLAAAHFDHGLRGEESAAEADFVKEFCLGIGVPCHVGKADGRKLKAVRGGSLQAAARAERYKFLNRAADDAGAGWIATGHTQDDQAETVLLNILRGTGLDGIRGIPERRGRIVRPLLSVSRAATMSYCAEHGLAPRHDPTNDDPEHYLRNRIRIELLPLLDREYHTGVRAALLRLSDHAVLDTDLLERLAAAALSRILVPTAGTTNRTILDVAALAAEHPGLQRRIVRLAVAQARGTRADLTDSHVAMVLALAAGKPGARGITLPSPALRIDRAGPHLILARSGSVSSKHTHPSMPCAGTPIPATSPSGYRLPLKVPADVELPGGWRVAAGVDAANGAGPVDHAAILDATGVDVASLEVRTRQPGDRIDPLGMGGAHKKLQDAFVDAKVTRVDRALWPILADKHGPLWVPGIVQSERARVTVTTRSRLAFAVTSPIPISERRGST